MHCLPSQAMELACGIVVPSAGSGAAAEVIEDALPAMLNSLPLRERVVAAVVDRLSRSTESPQVIPYPQEPGMPVGGFGEAPEQAEVDTWDARGTVLSESGAWDAFVVAVDVMRAVGESGWMVTRATVCRATVPVAEYVGSIVPVSREALQPAV